MHHPTDKIVQTKAFATPVVEHWLDAINESSPNNTFDVGVTVITFQSYGQARIKRAFSKVQICLSWTHNLLLIVSLTCIQ